MRNTSSALPKNQRPPPLIAEVHNVSQKLFDSLTLQDLEFRPISTSHEDMMQFKDLHEEWFPLKYEQGFYSAVYSGNLTSIAAFCKFRKTNCRGDDFSHVPIPVVENIFNPSARPSHSQSIGQCDQASYDDRRNECGNWRCDRNQAGNENGKSYNRYNSKIRDPEITWQQRTDGKMSQDDKCYHNHTALYPRDVRQDRQISQCDINYNAATNDSNRTLSSNQRQCNMSGPCSSNPNGNFNLDYCGNMQAPCDLKREMGTVVQSHVPQAQYRSSIPSGQSQYSTPQTTPHYIPSAQHQRYVPSSVHSRRCVPQEQNKLYNTNVTDSAGVTDGSGRNTADYYSRRRFDNVNRLSGARTRPVDNHNTGRGCNGEFTSMKSSCGGTLPNGLSASDSNYIHDVTSPEGLSSKSMTSGSQLCERSVNRRADGVVEFLVGVIVLSHDPSFIREVDADEVLGWNGWPILANNINNQANELYTAARPALQRLQKQLSFKTSPDSYDGPQNIERIDSDVSQSDLNYSTVQDNPPQNDKTIEDNDTKTNTNSKHLAYILTLGVTEEFRRRGLAQELIRQAIELYERKDPLMKAIYLHVVTYNEAAIRIYESLDFIRLKKCTNFYTIYDQNFDSFLCAFYCHRSSPSIAAKLLRAVRQDHKPTKRGRW